MDPISDKSRLEASTLEAVVFRLPVDFEKVLADYEAGDVTRREAAEQLGVSVGTFDSWCKTRVRNAR